MAKESNIIEITKQLPSTVEKLVDFVIVGNEAVKTWKNKLRAIDKANIANDAYKQTLVDGQKMGELVLIAEAKLGELLISIPNKEASSARGTRSLPSGINKKESHYAQEIHRNPEIVHNVIAKAIDKNDIATRHEVLKAIKNKKHEKKIEEQRDEIQKGINKPTGLYDIIVVDPPWKYGRKYDAESGRVSSPYPEMSFDELKEMEIPSNNDCILWCWTTDQFIWDAKELLENWGFDYKVILIWDKDKMGIGSWLRLQCEFCLLGIKGKPLWEAKDIRDIIREPRTEHSVKPESFYKMIDDNFIGRKLDYFGRKQRGGWEIYGAGQDSISE